MTTKSPKKYDLGSGWTAEHDVSQGREAWERDVALAATRFSAIMGVGQKRQRGDFATLAEALAWAPPIPDAQGRKPLIYAIAPARALNCTQRAVHLDAGLIALLKSHNL